MTLFLSFYFIWLKIIFVVEAAPSRSDWRALPVVVYLVETLRLRWLAAPTVIDFLGLRALCYA